MDNADSIMLRVPKHYRSALDQIARERNRNWSQHAREILRLYIKQNQRQAS